MSDEQEAEVAEEEETETQEGLQEGDFISLDYTARTVEDGDLVDTTSVDVAEEEEIETEGREFGPRTIVLGAGHIFDEVEDDIYGKEAGDEGSVTVELAFGEYDNGQVRTVSADKISEDERYPGAQVNVDGQQGYVETIIGGRARVDFNHPLAGEDLEYEYEIVDEVDDEEEKAKGLFSMYIDADLDMWIQTDEAEEEVENEDGETETETVEKETLYIEATPQLSMNQQWMFQKQQIAQDVIDRLDLDRVIVQETIDGSGMGGMMGGMGGMGGGDIEEALEDVDIDEDEIVEELEAEGEDVGADETDETEE
ncbi:FKBP-type peptidyl-prolyl cis-trans isomerase [Haladaptatus sp. NG-WS-4]